MHLYPLTGASNNYFETLFNAVDVPVFIVDKNHRIWGANQKADEFHEDASRGVVRLLCGEAFHCFHEKNSEESCGKTEFCNDCFLQKIVAEVISTQLPYKDMVRLQILRQDAVKDIWLKVSGKPISLNDQTYAVLTLQEITELMELRDIIPICMHCKKVRDDQEYWLRLEEYLETHINLEVSHGICPDCFKEKYPKYADNILKKISNS